VVDDDAAILAVVSGLLSENVDYNVLTATTGQTLFSDHEISTAR